MLKVFKVLTLFQYDPELILKKISSFMSILKDVYVHSVV